MTLHTQKLSTLIAVACTCGFLYVTQANAAKLPDTATPIIGDTSAACESLNGGQLRYRENKLQICSQEAWMDVTNGIPNPKVVFLSSTSHTGNLGGVAGADAICQNLADVAGLTGTYKAWISDSTSQPLTSFTHFQVPYILVDGTIVADNWEDLTTSTIPSPYLQNAIVLNEWGESVDNLLTWTATGTDGKLFIYDSVLDNCWNWTYGTGLAEGLPYVLGWFGQADKMISAWTAAGQNACDSLHRLYCFEQ